MRPCTETPSPRSLPPSRAQVRWAGPLDRDRPDLGLARLDGIRTVLLHRAAETEDHYSHHAYLGLAGGTLFAIWSNHVRDEDGSGQRVCGRSSTDGGQTWSAREELFPPMDAVRLRADQDDQRDRVLIANGFAHVGGTLYAIAEAHMLGEHLAVTPPPGIPEAADAVNRTPESRPGLGRLARSLSPAGALGPIFWLVDSPPVPRKGFPTYPSASDPAFAATARAINDYLAAPEHWPSWEFLHHTCHVWAEDGHLLCEPTQSYRLADGSRARIWRDLSRGSERQYVQFETGPGPAGPDGWQRPQRSGFRDAYSRSAVGNLPDGTAYIINNPGRGRDPLVISLSADGLTFDRHGVIAGGSPPVQFEGVAKGPGFQYPHALLVDDTLHVLYSIGKEDVELASIPLSALAALEPQPEV